MLQSSYQSFEQLPVILNMKNVAAVLGISESGAYDLCKTKGFPAFRVGNRILIQRDKLIEWIEQQAAQ